jgi:hypothetical protein
MITSGHWHSLLLVGAQSTALLWAHNAVMTALVNWVIYLFLLYLQIGYKELLTS